MENNRIMKELFVYSKTKKGFKDAETNPEALAFIEDTNQICVQGKYFNFASRELLFDTFSYGVEFDETVDSPVLTRIGNPLLHKKLPIQSEYKGCIAQGQNIIYYLNPNDWRLKAVSTSEEVLSYTDSTITLNDASTLVIDQWILLNDTTFGQITNIEGNTITINWETTPSFNDTNSLLIGSVLNGYDGTVGIHIPRFYGRSGTDPENPNKKWVRISTLQLEDDWQEIPEMIIDAYRCTVLQSVPENMGYLSTLPANSLISVVNTNTYCRGGQNRQAYDSYLITELEDKDQFRSDLGKPRTGLNRATMRTYANNTGSELLCYEYYKWIFYWNYVIEYANFNCQDTYKADLTSDGYRQGGLGAGITNMSNWNEYNGNNSLTPCGFGNSIGNFTGIKDLIIPSFTQVVISNGFNNWNDNTTIVTVSNSTNNSKLITQVKGINNYAFYTNANNVWGSVTYNISGLTDGQKVIFKEKRTNSDYITAQTILEVDTDGEVTVTWSDYNNGSTKYVGFAIEQESCNIKIYNVNTNEYTLQYNTQTLKMPRWRGFDNPFGDIQTNLDGVVLQRAAANKISSVYTTINKEEFTDVIGNKTIAGYEVAQDGYIKEFDLGETAEIIPSSCTGAAATTYICDYHSCNAVSTVLRTLLVGGNAAFGGVAGLGYFHSSHDVGTAFSDVGFRTLNRVS